MVTTRQQLHLKDDISGGVEIKKLHLGFVLKHFVRLVIHIRFTYLHKHL